MLYHSMIQLYLDNCNIVWAVGGSYLDHLFKGRKKAIRAITFAKWHAHSDPIFEQLKILKLKLKQINIFQTCCFVYKSLHSQFRNFFIINNEIYHYNTRTAYKIHQIQHSLNVRARSIRVHGVKMWNSLSNAVTQSPSFRIFKKASQLHRLQLIQNALARAVSQTPLHSPISSVLHSLHWLKIEQRIQYKIISITHNLLHSATSS